MRYPVALLVVALLVVGLLAGCSSERDPRRSVTPTADPPTATGTSRTDPTPEQVVTDPRSRLLSLARGREGTAASVWRWCGGSHCRRPRYAVAVTDDGFRTRAVADLPTRGWLGVAASGDRFVVLQHDRPRWLLRADGQLRELARTAGAAPASAEELVLGTARGPVAIDVDRAGVHRIPTPARFCPLTGLDSRLRGVTCPGAGSYLSSADAGASWERIPLPVAGAFWQPVTGAERALIEGADGATLFPFVAVHRYDEATREWHSTPGPRRPTAYLSQAVEQPDGRLLLVVSAWGDQRGSGTGTRPGLWRSTDSGWDRFEPVTTGPPFAGAEQTVTWLLDVRRTASGLELVAAGPDERTAWRSADAGRSWTELAVR